MNHKPEVFIPDPKNEAAFFFRYRNWRGEVGVRHCIPITPLPGQTQFSTVWYGGGLHYQGQPELVVSLWDLDKHAERHFLLRNVLVWNEEDEVQ